MTTKDRLTPSPAFQHPPQKGWDPLMMIFKAATALVVVAIVIIVIVVSNQLFGAFWAGIVAGIWAAALIWMFREEAGKQV